MRVCLDLFVNDTQEYNLWFLTISTLILGEGRRGNNNLVSEKLTKYFIFLNIFDDDCLYSHLVWSHLSLLSHLHDSPFFSQNGFARA